MWFRNLQIYRLPENWALDVDTLQDKLAARPFVACGSQDMLSRGWVSPTRDDRFVLAVQGQFLVSLQVEQKLLPASVVNQVASDRAEDIEAQQGYKPGRKQMKEIKDAVLQELLPRAFARRRKVFAWIAPREGWLVVDAASPARAEEMLEALRDVLDELPAKLLQTRQSPVSLMSGWLAAHEAAPGFSIDQDCELRSVSDEKAAVRYVRHALDGQDVQDHLAAGKLPTRLALTFDDRISFVLTEKLEVKRLAFLDVIKEEAERQADLADMQIEADFALMSGELLRLIPALIGVLGGEQGEGATGA
jgi:recombination associated protein RdgC